jgi:hypothetical protein
MKFIFDRLLRLHPFRIFGAAAENAPLQERLEWLENQNAVYRELLTSLMIEVDALRMAVEESSDGELSSAYADGVRRAGLLSHNSAGATDGLMKLAGRFVDDDPAFPELATLRRLGYDAEQLEEYLQDAELRSQYT